jgi:predicted aspartyl protease
MKPMKQLTVDRVQIGRHTLTNVRAAVASDGALMLLGLPMLNQIGAFTMDAKNGKLIFRAQRAAP